jgi:hypothetical protein
MIRINPDTVSQLAYLGAEHDVFTYKVSLDSTILTDQSQFLAAKLYGHVAVPEIHEHTTIYFKEPCASF